MFAQQNVIQDPLRKLSVPLFVADDKRVINEHINNFHNTIEVLSGIVTDQKNVINSYNKFKDEVMLTLDRVLAESNSIKQE